MKKLWILLLLFLTACQFNLEQTAIEAEVRRVVSGQTIEVIIDRSLFKVRLTGINAPDLKQNPWGQKAKKKLGQLLTQKDSPHSSEKSIIMLETNLQKKDRYGRIQAYIWKNKVLINEQLIAQGYVLADLNYTNDRYRKRLGYAQDYARIMGYGIWNPKQPMLISPQQFRQQTKLSQNDA
jgi:micrococcal nuclease